VASLVATKHQAGPEIGGRSGGSRPFSPASLDLVSRPAVPGEPDEFFVTNRVVIRKVGVFSREIQHAPIEKIQDVTIEQGILGRMLGYGTVIVETASEKGMLVFPAISSPESLRTHIWGQAPATVPGAAAAAASPAPAPVSTQKRLEDLQSLRQRGLVDDEEYAKRKEILRPAG
jgi:hypothetical protein